MRVTVDRLELIAAVSRVLSLLSQTKSKALLAEVVGLYTEGDQLHVAGTDGFNFLAHKLSGGKIEEGFCHVTSSFLAILKTVPDQEVTLSYVKQLSIQGETFKARTAVKNISVPFLDAKGVLQLETIGSFSIDAENVRNICMLSDSLKGTLSYNSIEVWYEGGKVLGKTPDDEITTLEYWDLNGVAEIEDGEMLGLRSDTLRFLTQKILGDVYLEVKDTKNRSVVVTDPENDNWWAITSQVPLKTRRVVDA